MEIMVISSKLVEKHWPLVGSGIEVVWTSLTREAMNQWFKLGTAFLRHVEKWRMLRRATEDGDWDTIHVVGKLHSSDTET
jgi:hypothetical protein